jgi:hypothetical protein
MDAASKPVLSLPQRAFLIRAGWFLLLSITAAWLYIVTRPPFLRPFCFDPEKPFTIEFGQRTGFDAMYLWTIASDGRLTFAECSVGKGLPVFRQGTIQLSPSQREALVQRMAAHSIDDFRCVYDFGNLSFQYVLLVRQGNHQRAFWFNGRQPLPPNVSKFTEEIGRVITSEGFPYPPWFLGRQMVQPKGDIKWTPIHSDVISAGLDALMRLAPTMEQAERYGL